jgi:hypothetical protein
MTKVPACLKTVPALFLILSPETVHPSSGRNFRRAGETGE